MSTEDQYQRRIDELERQLALASEQLQAALRERDAARIELERLRSGAGAISTGVPQNARSAGEDSVETCSFCDGEGIYWVHDFEMKCTRCDGTGIVSHGERSIRP